MQTDWRALQTGASHPAVTDGEVRQQLNSRFPPLPEQQRIVGILDEAFDGIATAKANAEKNLQNARALFESHLQSVFTQRGEGWVEKRLAIVCEDLTSTVNEVSPVNEAELDEWRYPFIRPATSAESTTGRLDYIHDGLMNQTWHRADLPKGDDLSSHCAVQLSARLRFVDFESLLSICVVGMSSELISSITSSDSEYLLSTTSSQLRK